jgi:hypothetical protein
VQAAGNEAFENRLSGGHLVGVYGLPVEFEREFNDVFTVHQTRTELPRFAHLEVFEEFHGTTWLT